MDFDRFLMMSRNMVGARRTVFYRAMFVLFGRMKPDRATSIIF